MKRRKKEMPVFESDDVVHDYGEIPAVQTAEGLRWVLPGNIYTANRDRAERAARKMDRIIRFNMKRTDRSLV